MTSRPLTVLQYCISTCYMRCIKRTRLPRLFVEDTYNRIILNVFSCADDVSMTVLVYHAVLLLWFPTLITRQTTSCLTHFAIVLCTCIYFRTSSYAVYSRRRGGRWTEHTYYSFDMWSVTVFHRLFYNQAGLRVHFLMTSISSSPTGMSMSLPVSTNFQHFFT